MALCSRSSWALGSILRIVKLPWTCPLASHDTMSPPLAHQLCRKRPALIAQRIERAGQDHRRRALGPPIAKQWRNVRMPRGGIEIVAEVVPVEGIAAFVGKPQHGR